MNWIRQNTFLAAFFAFTAVCAVALCVLLYFQYDNYSTVSEQFEKQSLELKRLQALVPFPNNENLKKLQLQKQELGEGIAKLETQIAKMAVPVEAMPPEQFQDKLRATVLSTIELAKQNEVKLPEKFYLGFDGYQTLPPKPGTTLALAKQLAGIEGVFKVMIENKIPQVDSIRRSLLPEEDQKGAPTPIAAAKTQQTQTPPNPIQKTTFEVAFKAEQPQLRKILNAVVQADNQFFIIRALQIKNERPKAPSKKDSEDIKSPPVIADAAKPPGTEGAPSLKFILGTEKLDVVAQIEIIGSKLTSGK